MSASARLAVRVTSRICVVATAGLLFGAAFAFSAHAHFDHLQSLPTRQVKMELGAGQARIVITQTLNGEAAHKRFDSWDADHNGALSTTELTHAQNTLRDRSAQRWRVAVDGDEKNVRFDVSIEPTTPSDTLTMELTTRIPLAKGERVVTIEDSGRGRDVVRTDATFVAQDGAVLTRSGEVGSRAVQRSLAFDQGALTTLMIAANVPRHPVNIPRTISLIVAALAFAGLAFAAFKGGKTKSALR